MTFLARRRFLVSAAVGALTAPTVAGRALWAAAREAGKQGNDLPFVATPLPSLLRNAEVQQELKVSPQQLPQVEAAVAQVDRPLFLLRDVPPSQGADKYHQLVAQLETSLQKILQPEQNQRLSELVIRAQGFPALIQPKNAQALQLESAQIERIQAALEETQRDMQKVAGDRQQTAALNENVRKRVEETLTSPQRQRLATLVGKPFDLSKVRQVACAAPELSQIERWHNSGPLSMEQLKGKVVALHFYAFG